MNEKALNTENLSINCCNWKYICAWIDINRIDSINIFKVFMPNKIPCQKISISINWIHTFNIYSNGGIRHLFRWLFRQTNSFSVLVFIMNSHLNTSSSIYSHARVSVWVWMWVRVLTIHVICGSFKCIRCTACLWQKLINNLYYYFFFYFCFVRKVQYLL